MTGGSVPWLSSVLDAIKALIPLEYSRNPPEQTSGGGLQNVPKSDALGISTSNLATSLVQIRVTRNRKTNDAIFGRMSIDGGNTTWYSMERLAAAIPADVYDAHLEVSPHFGFQTPHIDVPSRTYIEVHPANFPTQLEGCIGIGLEQENDALDSSKIAFAQLMACLPPTFKVLITEDYE